MFNSSRGTQQVATQKQSRRALLRRLSFECFETRSMLSAAPSHIDPDLYVVVSGKLGELHQERTVGHSGDYQGRAAFMNSPSEGGFLDTNAILNLSTTETFSYSGSLSVNADALSTISFGQSNSGITLSFDATGTGLTSKFSETTPVVTPTPILFSETLSETRQTESPSSLAELASPGGAIRMEQMRAPIDTRVGGPISAPQQKAEVVEASVNRLTVSTLSTQSSPVSGEWARAVVFEMAGGEPLLARKANVSSDVKLSSATRSDESPKAHSLSHAEIPVSLDAENQDGQDADVAKQASLSSGPIPYAAAVNAAVEAFMANWNSARAEISSFDGPVLRTTMPAKRVHPQTESAGAKPSDPKGNEQALLVESDSGVQHAGMEAAPVLIALALERWLHRRSVSDKSKAGTIEIGR